jgi:hypothetical protein
VIRSSLNIGGTLLYRANMNRIKSFLCLCLIALFALSVSESKGQGSGLNIWADPYQLENGVFKPWDNDMVRIGITTKERGLIFKITISNPQETDSVTIESLRIDVNVKYGDQQFSTFSKQISISYIYLPPKENYEVFVPIEFNRVDAIGSYLAELSYARGYAVEQHIEPYPFQFRVVSEDQFAKEIEQKRTGPVIIIGPWEVKILSFEFGTSVTLLSIAVVVYFLWRKKRKE